jgi:hypothetical protein
MEICLFRRHPGWYRVDFVIAPRQKKPRVSGEETAASASMKPQPINAWDALRDGATCSERLW